MDAPTEQQATPKTQVFLSYSRKDADFCARLAAALQARGYAPIYDQSDRPHDDPDLRLTAQDEWWTSLKAMIAASEVMVFIVSPDSAASPVCDDEIAHARALGKRVIAILRSAVDFNVVPERLRALNVKIDFSDDAEQAFAIALDGLCAELDFDIDWHRIGARLMRQADFWHKAGRPEAQLLRSGTIADADSWAARRPKEAPEPGALLLAFLNASRDYERAQRDRQRRIIGRAFVKPAEQAVAEGRYEDAIRFAAAGAVLAEDPEFTHVPELWGASVKALSERRLLGVLTGDSYADLSSVTGLVVTCCEDGSALVWDAITGAETSRITKHEGQLKTARFSDDGSKVITTTVDGYVKICSAITGGEICFVADHAAPSISVQLSTHERYFVTHSKQHLTVWDTVSSVALWSMDDSLGQLSHVIFCPNGNQILTAYSDGTIRIWGSANGKPICCFTGHKKGIQTSSFSPDGKRVVTSSWDETTIVWQAATGEELFRIKGHTWGTDGARFGPDGKSIVTVDGSDFTDHWSNASVWDANTGDELYRFGPGTRGIRCVDFSPDGARIITSSKDGIVRIWDASTGAQFSTISTGAQLSNNWGIGRGLESVRFSKDGTRIYTVETDRTARIFDAAAGYEIACFRDNILAIDPSAKNIVLRDAHTASIRGADDGKQVATLDGYQGGIVYAEFSSDGGQVVTGSHDHSVAVWDVSAGRVLIAFREGQGSLNGVHFSPDGDYVISASAYRVSLWSALTGNEWKKYDLRPRMMLNMSLDSVRDGCVRDGDAKALVLVSSLGEVGKIVSIEGEDEIALQDKDGELKKFVVHGNCVAVAGNGTLNVYSTYDGTEVYSGKYSGYARDVHVSRKGSGAYSVLLVASDAEWAVVQNCSTGVELGRVKAFSISNSTSEAFFSTDGSRLITRGAGRSRIWDLSPMLKTVDSAYAALLSATSNRVGFRTPSEAQDVLMQEAPDDLHAALLAIRPERSAEADVDLKASRHPNCYLSPTQFAEKFGLEPPPRVQFKPTEATVMEDDTRSGEAESLEAADEPLAKGAGAAPPGDPIEQPRPADPSPAFGPPAVEPSPTAKTSPSFGPVAFALFGLAMLATGIAVTFVLARLGMLPVH